MQHLKSIVNFIGSSSDNKEDIPNNIYGLANNVLTGDNLKLLILLLIMLFSLTYFIYKLLKEKNSILNSTSKHNSKTTVASIKIHNLLQHNTLIISGLIFVISLCFLIFSLIYPTSYANADTNEITITSNIESKINTSNNSIETQNIAISNNSNFDYHLDTIKLEANNNIQSQSQWTFNINNNEYTVNIQGQKDINPQIIVLANSSLNISINTDMKVDEFNYYANTNPFNIIFDVYKLSKIKEIKTDDMINPTGIDNRNPNFSWKITNDTYGAKTPSYQIVVIDENNKLMWDSNKITNNENIPTSAKYEGLPLQSSTVYNWTLTLWDSYNVQLKQETGSFTTALLEESPLKDADYIGYKDPRLFDPSERKTNNFTINYDMQILEKETRLAFGMQDSKNCWMIHFQPFKKSTDPIQWSNNFGFYINHRVNGQDSKEEQFYELINEDEGFSNIILNKIVNVTINSSYNKNTNITTLTVKITSNTENNNKEYETKVDIAEPIFLNKIGTYSFIRAKSSKYEPTYKTKLTNIKVTNDLIKDKNNHSKVVYDNDFSNGRLGFYHEYSAFIEKNTSKNWLVLGDQKMDCNWATEVLEETNKEGYLPVVRSEFTLDSSKKIKNAYLYTTGLGMYDCFLNGSRVKDKDTEFELKNGFTEIQYKQLYQSFDIKNQISKGKNTISAIISDGWWSDKIANYTENEDAFKCKLIINYEDNTQTSLVTNTKDWKTKSAAPMFKAEIYAGESYDANVDTSWKNNDFVQDNTWIEPTNFNDQFSGSLKSWSSNKVQIKPELQRNQVSAYKYSGSTGKTDKCYGKITNVVPLSDNFVLEKGETAIVDFGQNATGWENFTVNANKNTFITVKHTEVLNEGNGEIKRANSGPEGSANITNLRCCKALTEYITKEGEQTYHPSLTFFGFRYIEITTTDKIELKNIYASTVTSVNKITSDFNSSSEKINQLYKNGLWGMYSNFISIPTDCPQRDERVGWTADAQMFSETAMYLAENENFFIKYIEDIQDSQNLHQECHGAYPATSPYYGLGQPGWGGVAYADAGILLPYEIYKMYGNIDVVKKSWDSMNKYITEYIPTLDCDGEGGKLPHRGPSFGYGDWHTLDDPNLNSDEVKSVICTEYYLLDLNIMSILGQAIGKVDPNNDMYMKKYYEIKDWFKKHYFDKNGKLQPEKSQTILCCALAFNILTDSEKAIVNKQLEESVRDNNFIMQTGFIGTRSILEALARYNNYDYIYKLLCQQQFPSWLYSVDNGATTFWERWNSYTPETGYNPSYFKVPEEIDATNSFNHYVFGSVNKYLFEFILGINTNENNTGFKTINLQPYPCTEIIGDINLRNASGHYDSKQGTINVSSNYTNKSWNYSFTTPSNTNTNLYIPKLNFHNFTVNSKNIYELNYNEDGLEVTSEDDKYISFKVSSGSFNLVFSN